MDKPELRNKMKIKRKYFGEIVRMEADRAAFEEFFSEFSGYESFFIYNSVFPEARTDKIIYALLAAGKKVYLPRVEGKNMVAVPFYENTVLNVGPFGIKEPQGQAFNGDIDVTLAPLLAVNGKGFRLGYGGGYYDRYFSLHSTIRAGLGYAFQMEEFGAEPFDVPLDLFICERGIYRYEKE